MPYDLKYLSIFACGKSIFGFFNLQIYIFFDRQMNILDIIILICFIPALVQGLRKGFIAQVIAIISILAGVFLSFQFSTRVSGWMAQYIEGSEQVMKIVAFALILIAAIAALTALGKLLEGMLKIVMLGWLNKLLGVLFSFLKCGLIVGLVIMAFNSLNSTFHFVEEAELSKSVLYPPLKELAYTVFPYLKELVFWK
jgi:membrane protein required for colicin V production